MSDTTLADTVHGFYRSSYRWLGRCRVRRAERSRCSFDLRLWQLRQLDLQRKPNDTDIEQRRSGQQQCTDVGRQLDVVERRLL